MDIVLAKTIERLIKRAKRKCSAVQRAQMKTTRFLQLQLKYNMSIVIDCELYLNYTHFQECFTYFTTKAFTEIYLHMTKHK